MAATRFLAVLAVLSACSGDGDEVIIVDDPVGDTAEEGFAKGDSLAALAGDELTGDDYLVVIGKTATILAALNDGQIDQAAFGVQIIAAPDIFDFANVLIADHDAANADLDAVVRFYGIGYIPSVAADALAGDMTNGLSILRATPAFDFDFTFVELQVINHAQAEVLLDELAVQVGPGAMGDYIAGVRDGVSGHLGEAMDLLDTFY